MPGRINPYKQRHDPYDEVNDLKEQLKKWILTPIVIAILPIDIAIVRSISREMAQSLDLGSPCPTETTSRRQQPTPQKTDLHTILDT